MKHQSYFLRKIRVKKKKVSSAAVLHGSFRFKVSTQGMFES